MKKANGITINDEDYEIIPPTPSDEGRGVLLKKNTTNTMLLWETLVN